MKTIAILATLVLAGAVNAYENKPAATPTPPAAAAHDAKMAAPAGAEHGKMDAAEMEKKKMEKMEEMKKKAKGHGSQTK